MQSKIFENIEILHLETTLTNLYRKSKSIVKYQRFPVKGKNLIVWFFLQTFFSGIRKKFLRT
jgi:hypothetical protein